MADSPQLINVNVAAERLSVSRATIYRLIDRDPSFPAPVKLGPGRIAFVEGEISAYVLARMAERPAKAA